MARWQGGLEKKQAFLGRLVDIGAELFAISAAVVRARMLDEEGEPTAIDLADLFCRQGGSQRKPGVRVPGPLPS